MKFDVVIGNVVPIFESREQYERFIHDISCLGSKVQLMEPEHWMAVFSQYPECRVCVEVKYTLAYDNDYFTRQMENIINRFECGGGNMQDTKKLLLLISRQILVLSKCYC